MQLSMFPDIADPPPRAPGEMDKPESAGRRRTRRARLLLGSGMHPLTVLIRGLRLHPDAAPPGDRAAAGLRCRDCARVMVQSGTNGRYLKCDLYPSRGASSDIRMWWPACVKFDPR